MNARRTVTAVLLLSAIVALVFLVPVAGIVTRLATSARDAGATGVLVFVTAYIVSTVALLPGSILTMAAGFAYGPVWGLMIASPASVAGATAAFLLGRTLLRGWAADKVGRSPRAHAIDAAVGREGFTIVLLLRLSPVVPFNVLNYVLSLTRVRPVTYVLASFIGMLPGTALYVYLGSLATAAAELNAPATRTGRAATVVYVAGFAATAVFVFVATRLARRAIAQRVAS